MQQKLNFAGVELFFDTRGGSPLARAWPYPGTILEKSRQKDGNNPDCFRSRLLLGRGGFRTESVVNVPKQAIVGSRCRSGSPPLSVGIKPLELFRIILSQ